MNQKDSNANKLLKAFDTKPSFLRYPLQNAPKVIKNIDMMNDFILNETILSFDNFVS